ncbi:MAG: hypothetical protein ACTHMI_08515 [Mucilaginibacter sp.]
MRTSLTETEQIEAHLLKQTSLGDALVFEARLLLDDELADKLYWQKTAYDMVNRYGRKQLRQEIEAVHQTLFNTAKHKSFSERIMRIFRKR